MTGSRERSGWPAFAGIERVRVLLRTIHLTFWTRLGTGPGPSPDPTCHAVAFRLRRVIGAIQQNFPALSQFDQPKKPFDLRSHLFRVAVAGPGQRAAFAVVEKFDFAPVVARS